MSRIHELEWETPLLEPRPSPKFEKRFSAETGRPGSLMRYWADSEWLSDTVVRLSKQIATCVNLDPDLGDRVGLVVSQDNSCRFCFGAQRALMRGLGIPEARITELEQQQRVGELPSADRAALLFARKLSRAQPAPGQAEIDALQEAGFDASYRMELAGHIALHLFFNRISTFIALPPQTMERMPDAWWMRLFQPLLKRYFLRVRHRATALPPDPSLADGPYGFVVARLDGLPMAHELRVALEGAFAHSTLSPRAAGLAFAVVARALGCAESEAEAQRLLRAQGTPDAMIDSVLTHLSADGLTAVEQTTVGFARDAVWYVPAPIQRRLRTLKSELSHEQFLELVGVVSLANSVCRLAMVPRA